MNLHRKVTTVILALLAIACASCNDVISLDLDLDLSLSKQLSDMKAEVGEKANVHQNVKYAEVDGKRMLLDIYVPKNSPAPVPVIVWIHAGAWREHNKDICRSTRFIDSGYAAVSINYRLTNVARFPAQIYDCKGAIRWLRANAEKYNINPDRIGVFGASAGGHLASLLGTSGGVAELEGDVGGNLEYSSNVQAVCDWFGPIDLVEMYDFPKDDWRIPVMVAFLGGHLAKTEALAELASPDSHIDKSDPPFLIMHGEADDIVPMDHSIQFQKKLRQKDVETRFVAVPGAGHWLEGPEIDKTMLDFFNQYLKGTSLKSF
jgi:acetyl esterase/lipase